MVGNNLYLVVVEVSNRNLEVYSVAKSIEWATKVVAHYLLKVFPNSTLEAEMQKIKSVKLLGEAPGSKPFNEDLPEIRANNLILPAFM